MNDAWKKSADFSSHSLKNPTKTTVTVLFLSASLMLPFDFC